MTTYIALLRGVNVGGRNKVPMGALREAAEGAGLTDVRTYVQSGNIVCVSKAKRAAVESTLEGVIHETFGLQVPVVVRTAAGWKKYIVACPFPKAAKERPSLVHLCLSKARPPKSASEVLAQKAQAGERCVVEGDALWIDYPSGAGRSKITPAVLDRAVGAPVTARNWRTVQKLAAIAGPS